MTQWLEQIFYEFLLIMLGVALCLSLLIREFASIYFTTTLAGVDSLFTVTKQDWALQKAQQYSKHNVYFLAEMNEQIALQAAQSDSVESAYVTPNTLVFLTKMGKSFHSASVSYEVYQDYPLGPYRWIKNVDSSYKNAKNK
ncbi:hypothetical protein [Pleionea sediminis]|uniref:hypothetical protein n=1 Tax=Pleionea sediminis TaxID=2569479 RepID=UPI001186C7AA|nr:hypothetical protein [Pleionea sediminis]